MCQVKCEHVVNINDESTNTLAPSRSHSHAHCRAVCVLCVCLWCVHFGSLNKNLISIQLNAQNNSAGVERKGAKRGENKSEK